MICYTIAMQRVITILLGITLLLPVPISVSAETEDERRTRIETELQNVERQILTQQRIVEDKQMERRSLERDMAIIESEITQAQLGIQARAASIEQLSDQIGDKEVVLDVLAERLNKQQDSLADLVRKSALLEDYSLVEVMLSKQNFSEFFTDVATFETLKDSLNESLTILDGIRRDTAEQRDQLTNKQQTEAEMKRIQELEKEQIEAKEREKEEILTVTKGEEAEYQALLNSQKKTAAQLRSQLFDLLGGGGGIPFGQAVELAQYAQSVTGIEAALILAILEQESNLGTNLGGCLFTDSTSDRPVMHPTRDEPVFLAIAEILGFDPNTRTVSCPIVQNGSRVGWGGAMGPSQFIPSTWAMYGGIVSDGAGGFIYDRGSDAIRAINGGDIANPFNNRDAFLATALLLRDNGARGTYDSDRTAALRYYAGWGGANNPANAFYGNQVMNRKARLAGEIEILSN
jgi:membrane-bound lytic murein transglycosylase B